MGEILNIYQHLPELISPIAFEIGPFFVRWYSLSYITAFLVVYLLLRYRVKKNEAWFGNDLIADFLVYAFLGVLVGGRLGYVLFYNLPFYLANPLEIISPFDLNGQFIGFYGMSYHGGLVGVALASWLFARKNSFNFWRWADFVVPAVPAGYFFGRIGNFLNGELYGTVTDKFWGMYFQAGGANVLRHPVQLYEAFFEGLVLLLFFWTARNNRKFESYFLPLYLLFHGFFRFMLEFFREPDVGSGIVSGITLGQTFSLLMMILALIILTFQRSQKNI